VRFASAADILVWKTNRVDADIQSWTLPHLLQQVSLHTGWRIYLEPGLTHDVSVRFNNQSVGDALRSLLGDLSFATVPETNHSITLFVFKSSRERATQLLTSVETNKLDSAINHVPNELIVTLKPGQNIEAIAALLGAKVTGKIDGINAYRLQFPDEAAAISALDALANNPAVANVDYNYIVDAPPSIRDLGSMAVQPLQLKLSPPTGNGQPIIGLIDTALQPMGGNLDDFILKSLSVAGDATLDPNAPSHGRSMAEAILRAAALGDSSGNTSLQIVSVDVYGNRETTTMFDVGSGIVTAVNNGANIINLSLGGTGDSQFLHNLIQQVAAQGIPIFAAAGNDGSVENFYPAAYPEVTAVTAGNNGRIASYANYGSFVDVMAPGSSVVLFNNHPFMVSGTSTATAVVSGFTGWLSASKSIGTSAAAAEVRTSPSFQPPAPK